MLPALLTTLLFAISAVCAHQTSRVLGGITANALRLSLAVLLLGLWAHTGGSGISGSSLGWFLLSGAIGFGVGDVALFQALPRLGSRLTILIVQCLAAPIAVSVEWLWLGNSMSLTAIAFAVMILAGVAIAFTPSKANKKTITGAGILCGLLAASGQALGAVTSRQAYAVAALSQEHIDGATAAYQRGLAGICIAWLAWGILRCKPSWRTWDRPAQTHAPEKFKSVPVWIWIILNSLAGPALGVACYQWALSSAPSGWVLPIVATSPLMVIPLAWWIEGEAPTQKSIIGGFVAVAGAVGLSLA